MPYEDKNSGLLSPDWSQSHFPSYSGDRHAISYLRIYNEGFAAGKPFASSNPAFGKYVYLRSSNSCTAQAHVAVIVGVG